MNKNKLLLLLIIIAFAVYYANQESQPKKTSLIDEPWLLVNSSQKKESRPSSPPNQTPSQFEIPLSQSPSPSLQSELDTSWLTDDNLEFILKNWEPIQTALAKQNSSQRKFHLRTDIANIYNCFYKAKTSQEWDLLEFLQELEIDKAQYTLFPLRVNGNHWGLFVLAEITQEPTPPMPGAWLESSSSIETKIYYTSSGGGDLQTEKKQLEPFIKQIVGDWVEIEIITPKDRNSKGYECGVYLVFYIREILETGELKLEREYSSEECQNFRREWKEKIGEKWGRWD